MKKKNFVLVLANWISTAFVCISILLMINPSSIFAQEVHPDDLEFRRQAVRRMIFDKSQDIPLGGLWPSKVVGLDVMHPSVGQHVNDPQSTIEGGRLKISTETPATATRWISGFNPFATYDVAIDKFTGSGEIGMHFRDTDRKIESKRH